MLSMKGDWRRWARKAAEEVAGSDFRLTSSREDIFLSGTMSNLRTAEAILKGNVKQARDKRSPGFQCRIKFQPCTDRLMFHILTCRHTHS